MCGNEQMTFFLFDKFIKRLKECKVFPNLDERIFIGRFLIFKRIMKTTKRPGILYAEDNEDSAIMLATFLGFAGIDVSLVSSVNEAFLSAQNKHFDLFLLDSKFPDGCGLELCKKLRKLRPQTPVVFYSADAYEIDRQKGLTAGAHAYLVKPNVETVAPTVFKLVK
jgi:CheY-like chemotaxis protein